MPDPNDPLRTPGGRPFAERLHAALDKSDLSLQRLRSALAERGLTVSTATLSYWSSGRSQPNRVKSLGVLQALEQLLEVEPGWLVNALPRPQECQDIGEILGRQEAISQTQARYELLSSAPWKHLMVHHTVTIGADGAQKAADTRQVLRAQQPGALGWTSVFEGHESEIRPEAVAAVQIRRQIRVADDLMLVEFALPEPAPKGTIVHTQHRVGYPLNGDVSDFSGYAVARPMDILVHEVVFEGELPQTFHRWFHAVDGPEPVRLEELPQVYGNRVQVVLQNAAPGLHQIRWHW